MNVIFDRRATARYFSRILILVIFALGGQVEGFGQCSVSITGDATICTGESTVLTATVPPEAGLVAFAWKKNDIPISGANTATLNTGILTTGNFTYTVTISGGNCTNPVSADQVVVVYAKPTANFTVSPSNTMTNPQCATSPISFNAEATSVTYSWNFGDNASSSNTSAIKNPNHTFTTGAIGCGNQTYEVTLMTTANGCSTTKSETVKVKQLPDVTLTTPGLGKPFTQCSNQLSFNMPVTYSPSVTGCSNSLYEISWGDEPTSGTFSWSSSSPPSALIHNYSGQGTWQLIFRVTGSNGCVNQKTYNVFNGSNPSISFGSPGSTDGCVPYTVNFPISNYSTNAEGTYYLFDYGDGTITDPIYDLFGATIAHTYNTSSCGNMPNPGTGNTFTAKATAINACNLIGTTVWVNNIAVSRKPTTSITTNLQNNIGCVNQSVSFSFTAQNSCQVDPSGQIGSKMNATWDFGDGTTETVYDVFYNNLTPAFRNHSYSTPGNKTITLTINNQLGSCGPAIATKEICINPIVTTNQAQFNVDFTAGCAPFTVSTTNTSTVPNTCGNLTNIWSVAFNGSTCAPGTSDWQWATGSTTSSTNPSIIFSNPGTYTITLTVSNGCGSATHSKQITVKAPPEVQLASLNPICQGDQVTPSATYTNCGTQALTYLWTMTGGNPSTSSTPSPGPITYANPGNNYTIIIKASNECGEGTASKPLTVNARPSITINGPSTACAGSTGNVYTITPTPVPANTSITWTVSSGGTITAGGNTSSITVTWATSGNKTITANYTNSGGCSLTTPASYSVTVNPIPVPVITGPNSVCINSTGKTYTTEAGMSNYTWTIQGGTITSGQGTNTVTVTWITAGSQSVSVNYTNGNGCTASGPSTFNVVVNPLPIITISGNQNVCVGATGVVYSTQAGMTNYAWAITPGGTISPGGTPTSNTATVSWTGQGTQTISVNYTNTNGCTATAAQVLNVSVNPLPLPTITGPSTACEGTTSNYTTQSGMTGYSWTVPTGGTITSGTGTNSITVLWNSPGSHTVKVNYVNGNNCTAATPTTYNVTVSTKPAPIITGISPVCAGAANIPYTTESGMNNYSWTVSAGGQITSGQGSSAAVVTWNTAGNQTMTVTYANGNGCSPSTPTTKSIVVNSLPIPTINGLEQVCKGSTGIVYTTESGMANYQWTVTGGTITGGGSTANNTVTITWGSSGNKTISVNYQNTNGCSAQSATIKNITVFELPNPGISGDATACKGTTKTYTTEPGMTGYSWTVSAGGTITAGAGTSSISVVWNTEGNQSVSVNYMNANGCMAASATTKSITINPIPTPTITGEASVCRASTGNVYSTQSGNTNYQWTVSAGGTITSGAGSSSIQVTWNTSGNQIVSVNYANGTNCTAPTPSIFNVTVNNLPTPTIAGSISVCTGSTGIVYTTEPGMTGYTWSISSGGTITAGATSNALTVSWLTAGAQWVKVNYTNTNGCTASTPSNYPVTVNSISTPTLSGLATVCEGTNEVTYTTDPGNTNYQWSVSAGGSITSGGNTNIIAVSWNTVGPQSVTVNYTNSGNCSSIPMTKNIVVNPKPIPTLSGETTICAGTTNVLYTTEAGMNPYNWTVSTGGTITGGSTTNQVSVTWNTAGSRSINVNYTNPNGCTASSPTSQAITVYQLPQPTISGNTSVCVGSTGNVYTTEAGMSNYTWVVSPGGTITSGGTSSNNSLTVTWNNSGPQTVSVNYKNINNCLGLTPTVFNVTVNSMPTPTITGPSTACQSSTGHVYTTQTGMSAYNWSISAGGQILSGLGTNSITVGWNIAGDQSVSVNYLNPTGCGAPGQTNYPVTVYSRPSPIINGNSTSCAGSINNVYTTEAGMIEYVWAVSAGGAITSGANTNSISVTWNNSGAKTVTVNYKNANGCTATNATVFNVVVNSLPLISIEGPNSICVGSTGIVYTTQAGNSNYQWAVSTGGAITEGGTITSNTATISWTTSGSKTVSVSYTNSDGCNASTVYNVTVNPLPIPQITGPSSVCFDAPGTTYATETGMSNYLWQVSTGGSILSGGTSSSNTITIDWNATGPQTVSVAYTNSNGCVAASPVIFPVTVNTLPIATATGSPATIPNGAWTTLTASATIGLLPYNYQWLECDAKINQTIHSCTNNTVRTKNISTVTSYDVVVTDANGCDDTASVTINVTGSPLTLTCSSSVPAVCKDGNPVQLMCEATGGNETGYTYTWTGPNLSSTTIANPVFTPSSIGNPHIFTVVVNDGYNNSPTCEVQVTVHPLPSIFNLTSSAPGYCTGTTQPNLTLSGSESGVNYQLFNNGVEDGLPIPGNTNALSFPNKPAGLYSVQATSSFGCTNDMSGSISITEWENPVANAGTDQNINSGMTQILTGVASNGTLPYQSFIWAPSFYLELPFSLIAPAAGVLSFDVTSKHLTTTQPYYFKVIDSHGCFDQDTTIVTVGGEPLSATISASPMGICFEGGSIQLNAQGVNGAGSNVSGYPYTYTWSSNKPVTPSIQNVASPLPVTPVQSGDYIFSVIVSDGYTTLPAQNITVTVHPLPVQQTVTGGGSYCAGGEGLHIGLSGKENGVSYQLFNGTEYACPAVIASGTGPIDFGVFTEVGTYTVVATNPNTTCTDDMTGDASISINPKPIAVANNTPTIPIPHGTSTTFANSSVNIGNEPFTYSWIPTTSIFGPSNILHPTTKKIYGATLFTFYVTDANDCKDTATVSVVMSGPPLGVNATATPGEICFGEDVQLTATGTGGNGSYTYSWVSSPAGYTSTQQNPVVSPAVTTNYTITVNDGFNTHDTTVAVVVNQLPVLYSTMGGGEFCDGDPGPEVHMLNSENGITYTLWHNTAATTNVVTGSGSPITFGEITTPGIYYVRAENGSTACWRWMSDTVSVVKNPLPQQFIVNGGGSYPSGGVGMPVGLSGSQTGIDYMLYLDGAPAIAPPGLPGTDLPLDFGMQTLAGLYTVRAINPLTGCFIMMNGDATVIINPYPNIQNVTGGGQFCQGEAGKEVGLDDTEIGVLYILYRNLDSIGNAIGTGDALAFGTFDVAGNYTVKGINTFNNLERMMRGSATITVNPLPVVFSLVPSGERCPGTELFVNGSQNGFQYILYRNNNEVDTVTGNGQWSLLPLGARWDTGYYWVRGVNPLTGCGVWLHDTTRINPSPFAYHVMPAGILCQGQPIWTDGSDVGISYQLIRDENIVVGASQTGTGGPLSFGPQTYPGTYKVLATDEVTDCSLFLLDSAVLYPAPVAFSILPAGDTCAPAEIFLSSSETGYTYGLYFNNEYPPLQWLTGNGATLSFGSHSLAGDYTIKANNMATQCETDMAGVLTLYPSPLVYNIQPGGLACAGATISLDNSQTGITYQLYLNDSLAIGPPVAGTGLPLTMGVGSLPGQYTVIGYNLVNSCSMWMNGMATLLPDPGLFSITPAGQHCSGVTIGLNGSEAGVAYRLIRDNQTTTPVAVLTGTGGLLSYGPQHVPGVYTVVAFRPLSGCTAVMEETVTVNPRPLAFDVLPLGANCEPDDVTLSGSQTEVSYELLLNGFPLTAPVIVPGTGLPISFGPQMGGQYTVMATNTATLCQMPMNGQAMISSQPVVMAGPDTLLCSSDLLPLSGSAVGYSALNWTTSGDGLFSDITILNPVYSPGTADLASGSVVLTLSAAGTPECPATAVSDELTVTFHPTPVANAGSDAVACAGLTAQLNGSGLNYGLIEWTTTGDGQISDPTILNPVYQPGNDDELAGTVRLILTLHGDATCTHIAHSDTLTLIIEPLPVAQAGSDTTICQLHQAWLHGSVTHATTVQWSTQLGDGTFSAPGSLHTFYSPGANDILTGAVKLVLSATGTGTCATVTRSDTLTLTIHPMAQVSAGTDLDVCASQEVMTLQGTASNYSNPVWNTTGFGNLLTPNLLTTPYERDPSDTIARSAMMWLTVNGTNQCINATTADTMMVTFQPLPVSVAGADTFVCQGYPITLSGVNHHSNGVNWTSLTDGIFNNPALLSPEYMPGPAGWASGSMNLVMTAWGTGTCSNETDADTVNLAVVMLPTSVLSGADTICQGDAATIRVDLTGMPPWTLSCTSGLESFNISGITESPFLLSVVPEVTSTYYITAMNDLHCTAEEITGFATIRVNPAPQPYTLTTPDGNIYCENEPGTEVRLNGSQTDVSYQLYLAGIATGSPVPGTGLPLSFGVQTVPGFYSAIGTHVLTGCSSVMNDTLQLIMWPGPDVDFTAGDACHGQPTLFTLTGTDIASIATWEWNFGDGFTAAYITAVDPVHQYPTWGTFLVTMTATDIHGCVTTLVHEVEVSEIPTALFTFEDGLCKNDTVRFSNLSTTATGFINTSHWNYGDGTSGAATFPSAQDGAHRYANAGTYQVTLTVTTDRGCTDVLSRTVTVTSGPNASFVNSSGCAGQAVQFTDATIALTGSPINEWNWDFGDPASGIANGSVLQHPQHVFTVAGTYNVTMTVTTGSGCQSSKTRTVVVATKPVAAFSADTACLSLPTQFSDLSVPNSAFITSWDWDFGDGTAHGSGQNPAHVYAQTGLFMTRLTVTNSNGCIHDTAAYVKVAMAPTALFSTSGGACAGQDVTFHDLSVAPENYLGTWHWDFGDGSPTVTITAPANPDVVHSYGGTGNYLATLTVTTNLGCQSVYSKMVGVQNGPIASFVTPTIRCEAEPVQFTDQSVMNGGSAITSRSWNFGDPASGIGNTSTLTHPVHNFTAAGSYAVSLKIMTALGCTDSVSYTVTVNARPQASFTVDTVCMGTASVFTDQSVAGSGIITNWYWDFGDGATPGLLQNPQHTYANFGTYNVALTVTNSAGCQRDTIHQAVVSDHPDAAFTHTTSNCAGHEVYFTNQSVATNGYVVRWNWLFGDGSSTVVHFPSIPDVTHIYQSAGTYYATLTITTSDSCQDSRTETVTIVPNPTAGFEADNSCVDEAVQFTDQSTNNNGGPVVSWMWDFGDPISGTNNTSVLQNPMHVFDTAGSYPVQLIISNINGCSDTITRLTIISPLPVARFGADSVCFGTPTHFADSSTANAPTLNNWLWNFGDGTTSVYQNPDHLYGQWGSYEVNLSVTNANGCQHDTVQPVFVKPMPAAAFDFVGNCAQTAVQFSDISATPAGVINTWLWDFGDGTTDTLQNPVHEFANGGSYEVTLTVTNSFGCIHSMSQTVHIKRRPSADFASQSVFCPGGQVSFQDLSIGNGTPVTVRRWDFGDGFTSTAANPVYNYVFADSCYNVSLVIINEAGCSDTTSQTVCVKPAYRLTLNHEPACAGVPALFSALNEAAGDTLLNVVWTFGDPASGSLNLSTDNPAVHVFENPGFYSVKLKGWNSEYCLDSTYVVLQILPQPEAAFFWDKTVLPCADSTVTFFNLSTGNGAPIDSLVWNFGDGTSTTQPGAIPFVTHKFSHFGVFGVSLTAYVSNGCSHSVTHTATVKCLSSYFDLVSEPACQGATLMIADSSAPSLAIGDWLWLFGDGEYEQYAAFKPIVTHTYDAPGTYEVKLTTSAQVNGNNISDVFTRTITVAASPSAAFTTNTLCSGDSVRFTDQSVTLNGAIAQWHWSFGEGDTSSRQNPVHSYANDTSFLVSLVVVNDSGCRDTAQRQINLFPRPVVMLSPRSGAFCGNGYTVTFRDTSGIVYPMYQWIWEPGDTLVSTADSALHTFPDGHHQVILTVTTESGCVNSDTAQIVTMPSPRAAMTVDPARAPITKPEFMFTDQSVTMGNSPLIRWEWIIGDTVFSTAQSVPYNFNLLDSARPDTGVHRVTLRVYNMDGCTDSTSRTIYLDPELVLITPTAFTPNRNGINDTFKPYIKYEMTGSYLMQIFNRWGQMVFETTDHTVGWNGNSAVDNSYCQAGMYAWIITLNNPQGVAEAHTGTVMLVR